MVAVSDHDPHVFVMLKPICQPTLVPVAELVPVAITGVRPWRIDIDRLVLAYEPGFIVVYSGGNDINARRTAEQVFESFQNFVGRVREKLPETPIAYISIAGNPKRWAQVAEVIKANALIETYTKQNPNLVFIDVFHPMLGVDGLPRPEIFSADNLHMNAEGYKLWTQIVGPYLPKPSATADSR
jgi:lysophospholipase L1-like esterase